MISRSGQSGDTASCRVQRRDCLDFRPYVKAEIYALLSFGLDKIGILGEYYC